MSRGYSPSSAFFGLTAAERAAAYEAAQDRYGVTSFWDLDPGDRAAVYDRAVADANMRIPDGIGWGAE